MKVLLILVDGMRPDAICNLPQASKYLHAGACTLSARTVMPSVTLPCHMSLFHSVDPDRHGTTTNTYTPQARPIRGLCEVLKDAGKRCAFFYDWEQLRDLTRPGSLVHTYFYKGSILGWNTTNDLLTQEAISFLRECEPDFAFLYLGYPDDAGHRHGWMSPEYLEAITKSWENIDLIMNHLPEDYTVIITADHGGHARTHGENIPEDMTIPIIAIGKDFPAATTLNDASILDLAPTIAALLGVQPDQDWDGKALYMHA